jgi:hypothetical protein
MNHSAKFRVIYLRLLHSDEFDIIADKESQKILIGKCEGNKSPGNLDIDDMLICMIIL